MTVSSIELARAAPFALLNAAAAAARSGVPADWLMGLDGALIYGATVLMVGALLAGIGASTASFCGARLWPLARELNCFAVAVGLVDSVLWIRPRAAVDCRSEKPAPASIRRRRRPDPMAARGALAGSARRLLGPLMEGNSSALVLMRWVCRTRSSKRVDPQRVGLRAIVAPTLVFSIRRTPVAGRRQSTG